MAIYAVHVERNQTKTIELSADNHLQAEELAWDLLEGGWETGSEWETEDIMILGTSNLTPVDPSFRTSRSELDELEDAFWAGYETACRDAGEDRILREVQAAALMDEIDQENHDRLSISVAYPEFGPEALREDAELGEVAVA